MIYGPGTKKILKKVLASNNKAEVLDLLKMFQDCQTPNVIDECVDVARSHLASLEPDISGGVKYYLSEKERGLGDYVAYCILYAHNVVSKYEDEAADLLKIKTQDFNRKRIKHLGKWIQAV